MTTDTTTTTAGRDDWDSICNGRPVIVLREDGELEIYDSNGRSVQDQGDPWMPDGRVDYMHDLTIVALNRAETSGAKYVLYRGKWIKVR